MKSNLWKRAVALITVGAFFATGCVSMQNVPLMHSNQAIARPDVNVGESVLVTQKDGAKKKFTVTAVEDDALVGKNVRVAYSDMESLDVARSDGSGNHKTAMIVGGVLLGVAVIAAAAGGGGHGGSGY